MQIKTINRILQAKITSWINTIDDELLQKALKKDVIITGGCIPSLLLHEGVNDYDVYIRTYETLLKVVKYYTKGSPIDILTFDNKQLYQNEKRYAHLDNDIVNGFAIAVDNLQPNQIKLYPTDGSAGHKIKLTGDEKELEYKPRYFSPNAISLSDDLQIVIRFHGEPSVIHESYDFVHATNYFTLKEGLVTNIKALESILTKQLFYKGSKYPLTSIIRVNKFIKRGYKISAGEMLKMIFQTSQLNLTDVNVLEEQLIGVDVAYFAMLIHALRNNNNPISSTRINILVDEIFNLNKDI